VDLALEPNAIHGVSRARLHAQVALELEAVRLHVVVGADERDVLPAPSRPAVATDLVEAEERLRALVREQDSGTDHPERGVVLTRAAMPRRPDRAQLTLHEHARLPVREVDHPVDPARGIRAVVRA